MKKAKLVKKIVKNKKKVELTIITNIVTNYNK